MGRKVHPYGFRVGVTKDWQSKWFSSNNYAELANEDVELRKIASKEKLMRIKIQSNVFNSKYIIPFASFIYFSHVDNAYMNDGVNKIRDVENFIKKK